MSTYDNVSDDYRCHRLECGGLLTKTNLNMHGIVMELIKKGYTPASSANKDKFVGESVTSVMFHEKYPKDNTLFENMSIEDTYVSASGYYIDARDITNYDPSEYFEYKTISYNHKSVGIGINSDKDMIESLLVFIDWVNSLKYYDIRKELN